ncbi:hypothetical protein L195_g035734 [Trifolium pratense]|uniref:Uncharacterized protein n=1 Tax=Trifolium pratense TaxID=57577 RepID=A0A2K3LMJ1_TRIPR|nr:hypothetical protein L195_g035734 [Trifolium pratense]
MKGGCNWASSFETLCYASAVCESIMNEDDRKYGSFVEMENPQLRKEESEKSDVENPEEDDTYNEESINYKSVIQGGGNMKTDMDLLLDAIDIVEGEEHGAQVTLFRSGESHVLIKDKAKVHKLILRFLEE